MRARALLDLIFLFVCVVDYYYYCCSALLPFRYMCCCCWCHIMPFGFILILLFFLSCLCLLLLCICLLLFFRHRIASLVCGKLASDRMIVDHRLRNSQKKMIISVCMVWYVRNAHCGESSFFLLLSANLHLVRLFSVLTSKFMLLFLGF